MAATAAAAAGGGSASYTDAIAADIADLRERLREVDGLSLMTKLTLPFVRYRRRLWLRLLIAGVCQRAATMGLVVVDDDDDIDTSG